ncbi:extracellular solute-binding protein [Paenibacillus sp. CF384]|uniref:extracellular solute-binding protein n=1 Tax=Paenibacillus sp. CF384 TaxID=1884382 RepID=UPI00089CFBCC|nr:extracellular solute-binding protein [Paenibacillus sp. CF384]SDW48349.1 putative aldouronate transport system substrate-binding protein [Paenibacillus sp. CF384]
MAKVRTAILLPLIAMLMIVTACSKDTTNDKTPNTASNTSSNATVDSTDNHSISEEVPDPMGPLPEKVTVNLVKKVRDGADHIPNGESLTGNRWVDLVKKQLNVDVNFLWSQKEPAYTEKIKLAIASDDLPDIFTVDYTTYMQLINDDMIEELTPYYEKYVGDALKTVLASDGGKSIETLTRDGKIYGVASMGQVDNSSSLAWVRKDWLDKLGLKEPTNMADLATVVEAFNKNYGTTGIPGQEDSGNARNMFGFEALALAYDAKPFLWTKDASGKVVYGSTQPEMKQALANMHELYAKGVLDKEFATTKSDQFAQKVSSGKAGVFLGAWWSGWWPIVDQLKNDKESQWRAYTIKDGNGQFYGKQEPPVGEIAVVKKGFKHPELLYKILNIQQEPTMDPYKNEVLENKIAWNGWVVDFPLWQADLGVQYNKNLAAMIDGASKDTLGNMPKDQIENVARLFENYSKGDQWMKDNPDVTGELVSRIYGMGALVKESANNKLFSDFYGVTPTMEKRWVNLTKLELDAFLKIILGNAPVDSFDQFVKDWNAQGGESITKEVNEMLGE